MAGGLVKGTTNLNKLHHFCCFTTLYRLSHFVNKQRKNRKTSWLGRIAEIPRQLYRKIQPFCQPINRFTIILSFANH